MQKRNKVILGVVAAVLLLGTVTTVTANLSLKDAIANVAGTVLGNKLAGEIEGGEVTFGVASGPTKTEHQEFKANFTKGGSSYATTSTAASYTLTTNELPANRERGYITWTPNVNTTLTTMASTSAPLAGLKTGEEFNLLIYNASTTAASTITFAAGTGIDLQEDEGGSVIVNGLELARLTFVKKADTDVILLVEPFQVGD